MSQNTKLYEFVQIIFTFALVCFGWIFFRANNINDSFYIALHLFAGWENILSFDEKKINDFIFLGQGGFNFIIILVMIIFMESIHFWERHSNFRHMFRQKPQWFRLCFYFILICFILLFGEFGNKQFIYFRF